MEILNHHLCLILSKYHPPNRGALIKSYCFVFFSVGRTRPMHPKVMITQNEQELFIGESAEKYRGVLKLNYPIEHGVVVDWDDMEALWSHIFDELKVSAKEHPILLTEPPLNPINNRIKTADIFFEKFGAPKIFF